MTMLRAWAHGRYLYEVPSILFTWQHGLGTCESSDLWALHDQGAALERLGTRGLRIKSERTSRTLTFFPVAVPGQLDPEGEVRYWELHAFDRDTGQVVCRVRILND